MPTLVNDDPRGEQHEIMPADEAGPAGSSLNATELFKERTPEHTEQAMVNMHSGDRQEAAAQLASKEALASTDWRLKLWLRCSNMLKQGVPMEDWTEAERLEYDPAKASWVKTATNVKVHEPRREEGAPASVYILAEDDNQRLHMGSESGSNPEWRREDLHIAAKKQAVLSVYTKLFADISPSHAVLVPRAWVYHLHSRKPPCVVWAEEDLNDSYGTPPKTLSLLDAVSDTQHAFAALQFFMFQSSNGQFVVHSVEAKGPWWTDPIIFSVDGSMGGATDSGLKGIKAWKRLFANIYSPLLNIDRDRLFTLDPRELVFEMKAAGYLVPDGNRQQQPPAAESPAGTLAAQNSSLNVSQAASSPDAATKTTGASTDPTSGMWEVASKLRFKPEKMAWESAETRVRAAAIPIAMMCGLFYIRAGDAEGICTIQIQDPNATAAEDSVHLSVKRQTVLRSYLDELHKLTPSGRGFWAADTWVYHLKQRTKRNDVRAVSDEATIEAAERLELPPLKECQKHRPNVSEEQHLLAALQFLMYKRSEAQHVVQSLDVIPTGQYSLEAPRSVSAHGGGFTVGLRLKEGPGGPMAGNTSLVVQAAQPDTTLLQEGKVNGGDRLVAVDGKSIGGQSLDQALHMLVGPPQSKAELTFASPAGSTPVHERGLEVRDPVICSVDAGFGNKSDLGHRGLVAWRESFVAIYQEVLSFKTEQQLMDSEPAALIRMMSAKGLFGAPRPIRSKDDANQQAAPDDNDELGWVFRPLTGDVFSGFEPAGSSKKVQGDPSAESQAPVQQHRVGEGGSGGAEAGEEDEEGGWLLSGIRNIKDSLQSWEDSIVSKRHSKDKSPTKASAPSSFDATLAASRTDAPQRVQIEPQPQTHPARSQPFQDPRSFVSDLNVSNVSGAASMMSARDEEDIEEMHRRAEQLALMEQMNFREQQNLSEQLQHQRQKQEELERSYASQYSQPASEGYQSHPFSVTHPRAAPSKDMPAAQGQLSYRILSLSPVSPSKPKPKWLGKDPTLLYATPAISKVLDEEVRTIEHVRKKLPQTPL